MFIKEYTQKIAAKSMMLMLFLSGCFCSFQATGQEYVSFEKGKKNFALSTAGTSAPLYAGKEDYPGVLRALKDLQSDLYKVTDTKPSLNIGASPAEHEVVIVGTLGKSPLVDQLVQSKKLDVSSIQGKWEAFLIQVIEKPMPNVDRALVIAGSDKRGTIFGIYDLSQHIGVSPWYYWADVPVSRQKNLYITPGAHSLGEPAVKYRGIFINDEQPALGGWVRDNFGGFNHNFYEKVFELILRMKGNFLWPAMWGQSFYSDDPLSPKLADEYGVVISTSHHEPMMRAHAEWQRNGGKAWNYSTNDANLREFWREGIKRMDSNESIVTLAMRGDGDEPMSEESNVKLLQKIVADQRQILAETTGKDVTTIPQVWALYKEVQDYYDKGMRVPDDVTLLLCDDNWGNIRKLPKLNESPRAGGYGIYYHYDYVGGPRNYKWLNTNPIPRVWEQMHMAYRYGADRIWIVNVGDIKPMEFPIQFFLDYAWNPERWNPGNLNDYTRQWAEEQFGSKHAAAIAEILSTYTKYNGRRKPELLAPNTYSLINYHEAETVVTDYNKLADKAEGIYNELAPEYKDAYYQLVLYPVKACANLNELKVTTGLNHLYAKQGRAATNDLAKKVEELFSRDREYSQYYNNVMANGKWNHMMDQTHISYTYWQQPEKDVMPEVKTIELPETSEMGVAIEGSENYWPSEKTDAELPEFDVYNQQTSCIDVFNRGKLPFNFSAVASQPWVHVEPSGGKVDKEVRLLVNIDWNKAPKGKNTVPITITGPDKEDVVMVNAVINNPDAPSRTGINGYAENNGYISIEAVHYSNAVNTNEIKWQTIPDMGRTLSAVTTFPVAIKPQSPGGNSPRLEYRINLSREGEIKVLTYISPSIDFHNAGGLRYGISIDDEPPQIINIHADNSNRAWEKSVANNIIITTSGHTLRQKGEHVLKFWMVDPGVVLQKIVVDAGGLKPSYLGPPESYFNTVKTKK